MGIAYLVLAYNNYTHLQRLIDALSTPYSKFYIHIDKRSEMPNIKGDNIFLIKRVKSYWSTFRCVTATVNLMKEAIKDYKNDYFVLVSGTDYPIVSNDEIAKRFTRGGEFLWMQQYHGQTSLSNYKYYHFICERRSHSYKTRIYKGIERMLKRLRIKKKIPFDLYVGSTWFALTRGCVSYILKEVKENKKYIRFFKNTRFPEECFFLTIIGNSSYRNNITHHLNYTDWSEVHHPAIISKKHIAEMKNTEFLFARKFNDDSTDVINLIDTELRGIQKKVET